MTDTERASAERFAKWLRDAGEEVRWEAVGNDPPDFVFEVEGERWAVEATELHQYIDDGDGELSWPGATASVESMCERIQQNAQPVPNKSYVITATGPLDSKTIKEVEAKAIRYINDGRTEREWLDLKPIDEEDAAIARVLREEAIAAARVSIVGIVSEVPIGYAVGLPGGAQLPESGGSSDPADSTAGEKRIPAADIQATLRYSLDRMLNAKRSRLSKLSGFDLKILLVWQRYFFADSQRVAKHLTQCELDGIDAIILIPPQKGLWVAADPCGRFAPSGCVPWPWSGEEP